MKILLYTLFCLVFTIACSTLDRFRGSGYLPGTKALFQVLYGMAVGGGLVVVAAGGDETGLSNLYFLAMYTLCFTAGISIGWAVPFGDYFRGQVQSLNKEWWQFGSLPQRPFASVVVRGLIWGGCTAPCLLLNVKAALISMISIPISLVTAAMITKRGMLRSAKNPTMVGWWYDTHEAIRGAILGLLVSLWVFGVVT